MAERRDDEGESPIERLAMDLISNFSEYFIKQHYIMREL